MTRNEFKAPEILELLKKKLNGNMQPLMLSIAETMRVSVLKNFETEGARMGKKWARLSNETIKQRKRKGYWPGKILQRTGQLKNSIFSKAGDNYAEVGTNLIYARIHNYGGIIHRSSLRTYLRKKRENKPARKPSRNIMDSLRIPARPFMKLSVADLDKIKRSILKELTLGG